MNKKKHQVHLIHFGQSKVYLGCTLGNGNDKLLTSHKPVHAKFQIGSRLSHPVSKDCLKKKEMMSWWLQTPFI